MDVRVEEDGREKGMGRCCAARICLQLRGKHARIGAYKRRDTMRLFLFSLGFLTCMPGLSAGQSAGALPPFRPLCDRFASPYDQMEQVVDGDGEDRVDASGPVHAVSPQIEKEPSVQKSTPPHSSTTLAFETPEELAGNHGTQGISEAAAAVPTAQEREKLSHGDVADSGSESSEMPVVAQKPPVSGAAPQKSVLNDAPANAASASPGSVPVEGAAACSGTEKDEVQLSAGKAWDPASLPSLRCKVLLAGDTMMEDFALQLNRDLRPRRGYYLQVVTRRGSCLSSSGRFNFAEKLDDAITEYKPDLIVLLLGCWDDVAIRADEGYAMLGTPAWDEAYRRRVQDVLEVLQRQGVPAVWVGLPVMGSKNAQSLHRLTEITGDLVSRSAVRFVDNRWVLADADGNYQARESRPGRAQVLLRRRDGKHATRAGDELLVGHFLPVFSQMIAELASVRAAGGAPVEAPEDLPISDVHSQLFR